MNILLVDTRVSQYEAIVAAVDPALALCLTFDFLTDTFDTLKARIQTAVAENTSSNNQVNSIGLVQHNYMAPTFNMLSMQTLDECVIFDVESRDPGLATWSSFKDFIVWCKTEFGVAHFDMMACAIYSDPNWKYVIDTLSLPSQTGVEFRASTDNTGSASLGGNWFLESHVGVNLKTVYFTEAVESYNYVLDTVKFVGGGDVGGGVDNKPLAYSYDGINWSKSTTSYFTISPVRGCAYIPMLSTWIAVGGGSNWYVYSSDGINWTAGGNYMFSGEATGFAYSSALSRGVMVGEGGNHGIVYSTTGIDNWTQAPMSSGTSIFTKGWGVSYSARLSRWVAVGEGNYCIAYSTNGIDWFGANSSIFSSGRGIAYSANLSRWVAVGFGFSNTVAYSTDGITWTGAGKVFGTSGNGVAYSAEQARWVAVGEGPNSISYSTDGISWTGVGNAIMSIGFSVAYNTSLSTWVVVGGYGGTSTIAYSTNGISWSGLGKTTFSTLGLGVGSSAVSDTGTTVPVTLSTFEVSSSKVYGDASFAISTRPTSDSSGAITYTSSSPSIATIDASGNWITIVSAGTVTFTASQAESYPYASATKTSNPLSIALGTSTFSTATFDVSSSKIYGDASFSITTRPTSNSSGAVTYTSSNASIATIDASGNWITIVGTGNVTFTASQAESSQYASSTKTSNPLSIALGTSTFSTSSFVVDSAKLYGDASFNITTRPTSDSTGAVTYTSSNPAVATIDASGNWITLVGIGDVSFNAVQAASSLYTSATNSSNTLTVLYASTLSSSTFSVPSTKMGGDVPFNIVTRPTSNSSGAITYSSSNTAVATIDASGNWITLVGEGTVTFIATQALSFPYASSTKTSNTLTVTIERPTLSSSTFSVAGEKNYGDVSFSIITRPTSNGNGAITYRSTNTDVATIDASGNWITLVSAGVVSFNAFQARTSLYTAAAVASNQLTVSIGTPTLSGTTFAVDGSKVYGDASFAITTRPTSNNSTSAITYSSSNPEVATIDASGNWITLVSVGTATFTASQTAVSGQFVSASKTSNQLTVSIGTPTLSSSSFDISGSKVCGDASFAISTRPTSNSSGAVTYSSSNPEVATIDASGNWITLVSAGTATFTASQAAVSGRFVSASKASNQLTVSVGTPTLSSSSFDISSSKVYGDASFAISTRPTSNSSGAITYSSSNPEVATIDASGNWITLVSVGTATFTASQAAVSGRFVSASKTSNQLTVSIGTPTLAFVNAPTYKYITQSAFTLTASSASLGAVTYSSSNTALATVNSSTGLVTLIAVGTVTITAAQAATALYNAPANATSSITIVNPGGSSLAGLPVPSGTSFVGVDLSGESFAGSTLSGVSFSGANLTNVNFSGATVTGTNFTNANISGATNLPAFSTVQKLQLLRNINNSTISAVQISEPVSGADINALLPTPVTALANATFTVKYPTDVNGSGNKVITITSSDVSNNRSVYIPMNTGETVIINGKVFSFNGTNVIDASSNLRNFLNISDVPFKIYTGSIIALNMLEQLNSIQFGADGLYTFFNDIYTPR